MMSGVKHMHHCVQKIMMVPQSQWEVEAAKIIFSRSVTKHKLLYQTCLCDGDAKTIHALNQIPVYTTPVIKEDCVNHRAKRMKTGIMTLRKSLMGTKDSIISGSKNGQVTEKNSHQVD